MGGFFCAKAVDPMIKTLALAAGMEFAIREPDIAKTALPVGQGIMASIDAGGTPQAMNALFALGVQELTAKISDPVLSVAVQGVLSSISFVAPVAGAASPALLDVAVLKDVVDGFVQGMTAAPKA